MRFRPAGRRAQSAPSSTTNHRCSVDPLRVLPRRGSESSSAPQPAAATGPRPPLSEVMSEVSDRGGWLRRLGHCAARHDLFLGQLPRPGLRLGGRVLGVENPLAERRLILRCQEADVLVVDLVRHPHIRGRRHGPGLLHRGVAAGVLAVLPLGVRHFRRRRGVWVVRFLLRQRSVRGSCLHDWRAEHPLEVIVEDVLGGRDRGRDRRCSGAGRRTGPGSLGLDLRVGLVVAGDLLAVLVRRPLVDLHPRCARGVGRPCAVLVVDGADVRRAIDLTGLTADVPGRLGVGRLRAARSPRGRTGRCPGAERNVRPLDDVAVLPFPAVARPWGSGPRARPSSTSGPAPGKSVHGPHGPQ